MRGTGQRELELLQGLSSCAGEARTVAEAAALCEASLRANPEDLPFAAIYLVHPEQPDAVRAMATSPGGGPALPGSIPLADDDPWRLARALEQPEPSLVRLPEASFTLAGPSREPGPRPAETAAVLRLVEPHGTRRFGLLVAGLNPLRPFDDGYRAWLRLVAAGIAGGLAHASSFETERRQIAALEESERRFAWFMNHLPGLAWIKDPDGRYLFVNDAAARAFGRFQREILGRSDEEIFPPETAAEFRKNDVRALAGGGVVDSVETLEHEDGVHHSLVSKFAIPTQPGVSLIGGIAIDITQRIRVEDALREADRRKDEFLATLAHELRNPLAPLRNALETMRLMGAADNEAHGLALGIMERQLQQMVRLIDDLLDLSRISRGKVDLTKAQLTLAAVLESALETMRPTLDASGRDLVVDVPDEPVLLEADLTRLAQVFANLLDNAIKYTNPGGHIRLEARREADSIVVRVTDDGIGISAEALPHVFDMFTQVDRSVVGSRGGLGIGLSIVRNLVTMHGGSVEARSEGRGRGAELVVRLPVVEAPPATAARAQEAAPTRAKAPHHRVLVVDDNQDSAASLALMLELKGNDVRTAHDGREALGLAEAFRPHIIFLDIGMPGLDGHSVCREIRARDWGESVPIVALTGWSQEEDLRQSRQSGFTHHLVKPAEPAIVDRLLAGLDAPPGAAAPSGTQP